MFICRCATAEQAKDIGAGVPDFVFLSRWDGYGVPGPDVAQLALDAHAAAAMGDIINLLGPGMVMFLGAPTGGQPGLDLAAARYTPQVASYALALEEATGRTVRRCVLVFLGDGPAVEVVLEGADEDVFFLFFQFGFIKSQTQRLS